MDTVNSDKPTLPLKSEPAVPLTEHGNLRLASYHFLLNEFLHARKHEPEILQDSHPEFVHQYRVSLRRCRTLLKQLKALIPKESRRELNRELKDLMQETNRLRDLDVFLSDKKRYCSLVGKHHHQGLNCFFAQLKLARKDAVIELSQWLNTDSYEARCQNVMTQLSAIRETTPKADITDIPLFATAIISGQFRTVLSECRSLNKNSPDSAIHELRIQCKKLRYLMEYFLPMYPSDQFTGQIKHLKRLQTKLGDFNDTSNQIRYFSDYFDRIPDPDDTRSALLAIISAIKKQHKTTRKDVLVELKQLRSAEASFSLPDEDVSQ